MQISYLISVSTETRTLDNLLNCVCNTIDLNDEIIIILDSDCKNNDQTRDILKNYKAKFPKIQLYEHSLNKDYSLHKNYGASLCSGKFIFQIDSDECPSKTLLINVKDIIKSNPNIEAFWIPRVNDYIGVIPSIAMQWGWRLSPSTDIVHTRTFNILGEEYIFLKQNGYIIEEHIVENRLMEVKHRAVLVNSYDPQCRIFLNEPQRIKWFGRLHERITGNKNFVYLPQTEELALYHDKNIWTQLETNRRYNEVFTQEENKGFSLPK